MPGTTFRLSTLILRAVLLWMAVLCPVIVLAQAPPHPVQGEKSKLPQSEPAISSENIRGVAPVVRAGLSITTVSPAAPTTGQAVTVSYQVNNVGIVNEPITGTVIGTFLGTALTQPNGSAPSSLTLAPNQAINGSLVIPAASLGSGPLTLTFLGPETCPAPVLGKPLVPCRPVVWTTASVPLSVVTPMVTLRITGENHLDLAMGDPSDGHYSQGPTKVSNGRLCVVHHPGCQTNSFLSIFSSGNSGTDNYFSAKYPLPANVELVGYTFTTYWPDGLSSVDRGGLGSFGSYGVSSGVFDASKAPAFAAHWENACQGQWGGLPVAYEVSFLVRMPSGTPIGETTYDPNLPPAAICGGTDLPKNAQAVDVPSTDPTQQPVGALSGWSGSVLACNIGTADDQAPLKLSATFDGVCDPSKTAVQGACSMMESMTVTIRANAGSSGSDTPYRTTSTYKPGPWKISTATLYGKNLPIPLTAAIPLPGSGGPTLDFRGGACPLP